MPDNESPELFPRLRYTKSWEDPADYATHQNNEIQNRKDIQSLFLRAVTDLLDKIEIPASGNGIVFPVDLILLHSALVVAVPCLDLALIRLAEIRKVRFHPREHFFLGAFNGAFHPYVLGTTASPFVHLFHHSP